MLCRFIVCIFAVTLNFSLANANERLVIQAQGLVAKPGPHQFAPGARLFDAIQAAQPLESAYLLGAALLSQDAQLDEIKLRAGLAFELEQQLQLSRSLDTKHSHQALLERLRDWVKTQEIKGRKFVDLNPIAVELERKNNPILQSGDAIYFPSRPNWVTVTGAVQEDCRVQFQPQMQTGDALDACPAHTLADPDWVDVIQPDGTIIALGVRGWNAGPVTFLAPGAVVLRRLRALADSSTDALNRDFASFLASRLLPLERTKP